jgi:hypothetical protein
MVTGVNAWLLQKRTNFGNKRMGLKLVASIDDRALAIRDHLLPLVRHGGKIEVPGGTDYHLGANLLGPSSGRPSMIATRGGILSRLATRCGAAPTPNLPYGLEV